jgi:hypothetical protein
MHTRSSNLYGILDNDDMFAFLGGLSLAVKHQTGSFPDTVNFLSLAGLLTPKQMETFKMALAKATGKTLEEQTNDYNQVRKNLKKVVDKIQKAESVQAKKALEIVLRVLKWWKKK